MKSIGQVALVVKDYDDAIAYFTNKLGFILVEDTDQGNGKRWVVVSPSERAGCRLLLAKAADDEQILHAGNQTGGRVFLFLYTDDFDKTYQEYVVKGVEFLETPRNENYGKVAVFKDLYGNKWDLIENC